MAWKMGQVHHAHFTESPRAGVQDVIRLAREILPDGIRDLIGGSAFNYAVDEMPSTPKKNLPGWALAIFESSRPS